MTNNTNDDWTFYTDNQNDNPLIYAFNKFSNELTIDVNKQELLKWLENNDYMRININTEGTHNIIESIKGHTFFKNRFLINKKFKQKLIEYYNPYNIYVKGPINIINKDHSLSNYWYIDLYPLK
jgi:hypothetical protein